MIKKITQLIKGHESNLQERMIRAIIFIGGAATLVGILESAFLMQFAMDVLLRLLLFLFSMSASMIAAFKYKKYDVASMIIGICVIDILFPITFIVNGGLEGGASVWFALGITYAFTMFSGVRFYVFLFVSIVIYGATYILVYNNPDIVTHVDSRFSAFGDSFFSVLAVGCICGLVLKVHMKMFEEEHDLNIKQKEEIEKNSTSKNALFANMNHEIRTPINAIIGLNEMILRSHPSEDIKGYAKDINVASKLLLSQVNDILDLSQMEMGKMSIVPTKYNTGDMFGEIVELERFQIEKKGLDFIVDIDNELPSVLFGDEKRIKQILLNILDNAKKYTEKGSVTLSVQKEEIDEGYINLVMKVSDTGIGIRKEDLNYIYESFNRFDEKENQRIIGSGLGLAITKQLVDLMEGEMSVDSIYRKGSIFTVKIKQKIEIFTPVGSIVVRKNSTTEEGVYRTGFEAPEARVLIVDDNRMNSKVVTKLLSSTKMKVDVADSGEECLELTKKKYYNVILLDYMMPGMNGVETLNNIRKQENGLCRESAVIALTGNVMSGARQVYEEQGFDGYVEKPVHSRKLENEIIKFLPSDIVELVNDEVIEVENVSTIQKIAIKKRKKIYITTDCVCDIPTELLEKYDIRLMYLYIKTPYGRFADTREIDSDSLKQYLTAEKSLAYGDAVTKEEYEEFFAECLTEAERVIHISLGSRTGRAHSIAVEAAKGFDHVHVIDSGMISCGQGLLVLHGARMAMEGKSYDVICKSLEKVKGRISMRFVMPGADIFYQNGRTTAAVAKLCQSFQLRPYVEMRQSKPMLIGLFSGPLEHCWKAGIRKHMRKKKKISRDVVFITHAGCSVKQQELVKNEILKHVPFEQVIIQKASFSSACASGIETIGVAYYSL